MSVPSWEILEGDARERLADLEPASVRTCVTSPPYFGLRDYGVDDQIGLESSPERYVAELVAAFREVRRVLTDDGTLWLNLGDSYARSAGTRNGNFGRSAKGIGIPDGRDSRRTLPGLKDKDLVGIPWMVAFALRTDGWYLRSDIVWAKPNPMPESVKDRPTNAHEHVFLLAKSPRYFYDASAIREPTVSLDPSHPSYRPNSARIARNGRTTTSAKHTESARSYDPAGRNARNVWTITTKPFRGAHFAVMPWDLAERCILAGTEPGDVVLDPFAGAGTTGVVALRHDRSFVGVELNPEYAVLARHRIRDDAPLFNSAGEAASTPVGEAS